MKTIITTVVGLAAAGVSAQTYGIASTTTHPTSTATAMAPYYETVYYDDCTSAPPPVPSTVTPITVTAKTTETYCPHCTDTSAPRPAQYTTTYETAYSVFCSTGLAPSTYTVTAPCTETGLTYPTTYVPPGFTVTSTVCTSCGAAPVTATLTMPMSCVSSAAVAPTTAAAAAGESTPPAAPGSKPAPAPAPKPADYVSNGTVPLSSPPVASAMPSTSPIMPFEGGATRMSMSLGTFVGLMGMVGAVAFAL